MSRNRTRTNEPRFISERHRILPLAHSEKAMTMQIIGAQLCDRQTSYMRGLVTAAFESKRYIPPRRCRTGLSPQISRTEIGSIHIEGHPVRSVAKIAVRIARAAIRRCRRQIDWHGTSNAAALIGQIPSLLDVAYSLPASSPSKDPAI